MATAIYLFAMGALIAALVLFAEIFARAFNGMFRVAIEQQAALTGDALARRSPDALCAGEFAMFAGSALVFAAYLAAGALIVFRRKGRRIGGAAAAAIALILPFLFGTSAIEQASPLGVDLGILLWALVDAAVFVACIR